MLDRNSYALNIAQQGDALELLRSLPDGCVALGFFDPQFRELLERQQYGNEGVSRQSERARLPAMTPGYIDAVIHEFARVLKPSGYLMRWTDKFCLCEGRHLSIPPEVLKVVDLIATDNERIGMGYRTRCRGDFLLVLQKPPIKAKATWTDHGIPDRWVEKVDRKLHPHAKPIELIKRLIKATTRPGDLVVDPAAGSFGTMHAALELERQFLGCDIAYAGGGSDPGIRSGLALADIQEIRKLPVELQHEPAPHSKFGGSVAARVLRCPASVGLVAKVPAYLRKVSAYAERGTALHAAMALLIDNARSLDGLVGETINGYTFSADDVDGTLRSAFAYADALLDAPGAEFYLEQRVIFPTIDAFGTVDLLIRIGAVLHVIDVKFGVGVRVLALFPVGDNEDLVNSQLLFYAAAARHSLPEFFAGVEDIVLTIVQPMSIEPDAEMVSSVTVTHAELDAFIVAYRAACAEALSDAPRLQRGAHCRFCPARPICPEHTKPLLDLSQFSMPPAFTTPPEKEAYLQVLADGLNLVDAVKDIGVAIRDQSRAAAERGDNVPGYALSAGRAERHWRDEIVAQVALLSLGFDHDDIIEAEVMRSPKKIETRAKVRGLKVPQELIVSARSGVSLVKAENVRVPVLGRSELARTFSEALEALQGKEGGKHD